MYELYRNVVLRGGLAQCLRKESFVQIGRKMRLRGTEETLPYCLRIIYFKYLFDFEQEFQVVSGVNIFFAFPPKKLNVLSAVMEKSESTGSKIVTK